MEINIIDNHRLENIPENNCTSLFSINMYSPPGPLSPLQLPSIHIFSAHKYWDPSLRSGWQCYYLWL